MRGGRGDPGRLPGFVAPQALPSLLQASCLGSTLSGWVKPSSGRWSRARREHFAGPGHGSVDVGPQSSRTRPRVPRTSHLDRECWPDGRVVAHAHTFSIENIAGRVGGRSTISSGPSGGATLGSNEVGGRHTQRLSRSAVVQGRHLTTAFNGRAPARVPKFESFRMARAADAER